MERWSASTGASTRDRRGADPKPGDNVLLTLDLRLQEKVEEILANTIETLESEDTGGGAVVVGERQDGGDPDHGLLSHLRSVQDLQ